MRWLPLLLIFLLAYVEISLFIKVAAVFGVAMTLLLVIFTSCVGISLVRNQGVKNLMQMQQKLVMGENPAAEMVKSVSLVLAGFLLLIPGFFTDFLGLLLLLPPVQKLLVLRLMPHIYIHQQGSFRRPDGASDGNIFEGEFQRKDDDRYTLDHRADDPDKRENR